MSNMTYYVVLPFIRDDETGELVAETGQEAPSEHSAMSRARAMIGRKAGAAEPPGNPIEPMIHGVDDVVSAMSKPS